MTVQSSASTTSLLPFQVRSCLVGKDSHLQTLHSLHCSICILSAKTQIGWASRSLAVNPKYYRLSLSHVQYQVIKVQHT